MVRNFEDGLALIEKWLRNKNTIEFLGIWEKINNAGFNSSEFGGIMLEAGLNRFTLSVKKWSEKTNGIGLIAKPVDSIVEPMLIRISPLNLDPG